PPPPPPRARCAACPPRTPCGPGRPHRHAKASSQLRQLIRQYGRNELRVHVPLGQFARGERTGNRLHHPGGFAAGPRLAPQLLEQSVQHRREPTARLEWRLTQCEPIPLDGTVSYCCLERLGGAPRSAGGLLSCKELAYASVRRRNSFCNIALRL